MKQSTDPVQLPDVFSAEDPVGHVVVEPDRPRGPPERALLILMLPGIRSSAQWSDDFSFALREYTSRDIRAGLVKPPGIIQTTDAVLRWRMRYLRRHSIRQIDYHLSQNPDRDVAILCHSMGAAILADIVASVSAAVGARPHGRLTEIVFVGSVCHAGHAERIRAACARFTNDAGRRDLTAIMAGIVNPWRYGWTGRFGFRQGFVIDRFYDLNHSECTLTAHLSENVLPVLAGTRIDGPDPADAMRTFQRWRYARRGIWVACAVLAAAVVFAMA